MQLEALGTETILIPTIELAPPTSFTALDAAITDLSTPDNEYDWLIFTSANAVHSLASRAPVTLVQEQGTTLHPKRIAAIGPATAKAIEQAGIIPQHNPILLPEKYVAESLAESLIEHAASPYEHYLLIRAEEARDVIPTTLEAAGHRVIIASAYRNITPPDTLPALQKLFATPNDYPDLITFTSSSTALNLIALLERIDLAIPPGIGLASIGPITSATLRELGYSPSLEASEPTIESLALSIAKHFNLS